MFEVLIVAAMGGFAVWKYKQVKAKKGLFFTALQRLNETHGTSFPTDESGIDLILGNGSDNGTIVFDPSTKKLCLVSGKNQHAELLDYSYIRQWQLKWTENSQNGRLTYKNVHFDFSTSDVRRPLLRIGARNKTHGDVWNARLGALFS